MTSAKLLEKAHPADPVQLESASLRHAQGLRWLESAKQSDSVQNNEPQAIIRTQKQPMGHIGYLHLAFAEAQAQDHPCLCLPPANHSTQRDSSTVEECGKLERADASLHGATQFEYRHIPPFDRDGHDALDDEQDDFKLQPDAGVLARPPKQCCLDNEERSKWQVAAEVAQAGH